jgi:hypothetical protein
MAHRLDGWLARIIANELQVDDDSIIDVTGRIS